MFTIVVGSVRMGLSWGSFVISSVACSFCDCKKKVETFLSFHLSCLELIKYDSRSSSGLQRGQSLSFRANVSSYRVALVYYTTFLF